MTGVVFFSSITIFSRIWFPEGSNFFSELCFILNFSTRNNFNYLFYIISGERATATGLACTMANLGGVLPALIGPLAVTDPLKFPHITKDVLANEIFLYMLMYLILSMILFAMFMIHFPDKDEDPQEVITHHNNIGLDFLQVLS